MKLRFLIIMAVSAFLTLQSVWEMEREIDIQYSEKGEDNAS